VVLDRAPVDDASGYHVRIVALGETATAGEIATVFSGRVTDIAAVETIRALPMGDYAVKVAAISRWSRATEIEVCDG
jgi:hypothetical protein